MMRRRSGHGWHPLLAVGLILLAWPAQAQAHAAVQGMGEFVGGFLHPLLTPPHLLVLVSLGLLFGQERPMHLRRSMLSFALSAVFGLVATGVGVVSGVPQTVLIVIGLFVGALVALAAPLPAWVRVAVGVAAGLALGMDSGVDPGTAGVATAKTLSATWASLCVWVVNLAFYSARLPAYQWLQTGVRVVGSWIMAIAFMMLAFALRR